MGNLWYHCPCCGKRLTAEHLTQATEHGVHLDPVVISSSGRGGIRRDYRPPTVEELWWLLEAAEASVNRLREELGLEPLADQDGETG